jgi:hypothetical protein
MACRSLSDHGVPADGLAGSLGAFLSGCGFRNDNGLLLLLTCCHGAWKEKDHGDKEGADYGFHISLSL